RVGGGARGETPPPQAVIGGGEPDPGLEVARMMLDGAAKVALGEAEISGAEVFLAEAEIVVGVLAEQALGDLVGLQVLSRRPDTAGCRRVIGGRGREAWDAAC